MFVYQSALIPRKLSCPKKYLVYTSRCPLFTHVNYFSKAKEALSLLSITVFMMNLFHQIYMFELACFRSSHQTLFYEINTLWYRNRCSAKLRERAQFYYAYSSTKDKLHLKYFITKIIWKYTSNSWWLLLIFLKKSLHSEKKDRLVETTLK